MIFMLDISPNLGACHVWVRQQQTSELGMEKKTPSKSWMIYHGLWWFNGDFWWFYGHFMVISGGFKLWFGGDFSGFNMGLHPPIGNQWPPIFSLIPSVRKDLLLPSEDGGFDQVMAISIGKSWFWLNYNDLTATETWEIMVSKGNHPQMAWIQVSEIL